MKAVRLLAENIAALLAMQHKTQTALGKHCKHSKTWTSQFLHGKREWKLDDLDRVADFFGYEVHELFQQGLVYDRRARKVDRRSGRERRILKAR